MLYIALDARHVCILSHDVTASLHDFSWKVIAMLQDQAAAEKTGIFHTLFQEYECSLAQKKSKAEFNLNKLSEMKDCLGDLYPEVELVAQRKLEEINNITPGTFRFSTSCN